MQLKFSLEDFKRLDTADLIINIWSYNHNSHVQCVKCKQYSNYCEKILKEKWKPEYGVFYHVVEKFEKKTMKHLLMLGVFLPKTDMKF